jgi:hypothetical protein
MSSSSQAGRRKRGERPIETLARRIVADVLGVPVEQHDDNSRSSMVDAKIHAADAQIPLEVVMDVAPGVMKQTADLGRYPDGIPLPAGAQSWFVMMSRGSRTSRLAATLPPLLAALDPTERFEKVPAALRTLGVHAISAVEINGPPAILLVGEGVSYSGAGPDLNGYVERFLARTPDVPYKLALAAGPGRAHAFIWLSISSDYAGWVSFRDESRPLPRTRPALPLGVTDVWLARTYVGDRVIRYSPEHGWVRTNRTITLDDEALLHPDGDQGGDASVR